MQSNRSNDPVRIVPTAANRSNAPTRISPLEQASRMPVLPTSRPARAVRRRGPINPVYLLLLVALPLIVLAIMVGAAGAMYRMPTSVPGQGLAAITPASALAEQMPLTYNNTCAAQTRQGDKLTINGQVKNTTDRTVTGVYLKAFLYGSTPGSDVVGSGVGNALGDIAPGASAPFTVTAQLSGAPGPSTVKTPPPAPKSCQTLQVLVDQVLVAGTPTPGSK